MACKLKGTNYKLVPAYRLSTGLLIYCYKVVLIICKIKN